MHGVPFTLKDCVEVAGLRATQGSKILADNISTGDSTVYKRLKGAGGILLGKTNLPEFALWWETNNLLFGATQNPWKLGYTPGGSSGGEGASLATGMSPLGVGTDLGGSIRQPSSFCGLAGLKPTLGRVPYTRVVPQTLFRAIHVGPMARNVQDVALALSIMAGPDGEDIYAPPVPRPRLHRPGWSFAQAADRVEPNGRDAGRRGSAEGSGKGGRRTLGAGDGGGSGGNTGAGDQ